MDWAVFPLHVIAKPFRGLPGVLPIGLDSANPRLRVHRSLWTVVGQRAPQDAFLAGPIVQHAESRNVTLRSYQIEAVNFLLNRRSAILADTMRLGKTITAVACWQKRDRLLVLAPLVTRKVWIDWLQKFHGITPYVCMGRTIDRRAVKNAQAIFCHYDVAFDWKDIPGKFEQIVFDEAHLIAHAKSKRARAAAWMGVGADRKIALTGTPLWNAPAQFWSIAHAIAPGAFGGKGQFELRYANPFDLRSLVGQKRGTSNMEEFRVRMQDFMLRREWKDVLVDVPQMSFGSLYADVDLATHVKLQAIFETVEPMIARLAKARKQLSTYKVKTVVSKLKFTQEPTVVWVWHRQTGAKIAKALKVPYLSGNVSQSEREKILETWQENPTHLVASMPVAQAGIDLSAARHALFAELDYTPAVMSQAMMRTFSPAKPNTVTFVIADHPIERFLVEVVEGKFQRSLEMGLPTSEFALETLFTEDPYASVASVVTNLQKEIGCET